LNHPLIANSLITQLNDNPAITTEFVVNGSLRNHLSDSKNPDCSLLKPPTKIAKIIAGIALAMRYVHFHIQNPISSGAAIDQTQGKNHHQQGEFVKQGQVHQMQ
jgi:hypothetical protein